MESSSDGTVLRTTDTSLSILARIRAEDGATLAELVESTGRAKSSVYAHLQTLRKHDFVTKDGDVYHVGLGTLGYGEHARTRKPEYDLARDAVDELVSEAGDESGFAVPENGRAVLLYNAANVSNPTFQVGEVGAMHRTAAGKAMLSTYSEGAVETVLDERGLSAPDEPGISDRETLYTELARTRERGYAVVDQEYVKGMRSLGAPVTYPDGRVFGALHVSAPAYRESLAEFQDAAAPLLSAARSLEATLDEFLA